MATGKGASLAAQEPDAYWTIQARHSQQKKKLVVTLRCDLCHRVRPIEYKALFPLSTGAGQWIDKSMQPAFDGPGEAIRHAEASHLSVQ
jgi:hypothetical protein